MNPLPATLIRDWHAHVYFDEQRREAALALRAAVPAAFGERVRIGRFNEGPVGPHPIGSYELAVTPADFGELISWLSLNHGVLDVLVHPNSDDMLRDHTTGAMWIGKAYALNLAALND